MAKLVRPKQIDPSPISSYVLTTSGGTVLWAPTPTPNVNYYVGDSGKIYYLTPSVASDITGYYLAAESPSSGVTVTIVTGCTGTNDELIGIFATPPGSPGTTTLTAGIASRLIFGKVGNSNQYARYLIELYKRTSGGTETLLRSNYSEPFNHDIDGQISWLYVAPIAYDFDVTDRLVFRLYASRVSGAATAIVTTSFEGDTPSLIKTTINTFSVPQMSGTTNYAAMFTPNGSTLGVAPIKFADTVTKGLPINTTTDSIGIGYDIVMTGGSNNFFVGYELFSHTSTINSGILGNRFYIDPNTTINAFYGLGNYNFINPSSNLLGIYMMGDSNSYNNICQFSTTLGESNTFTDIGYLFLGGIGNNMNNVSGMHVIGDYNNTGGNLVGSSNILGSSNYLDNSSTISIVGTSNFATNISNATILGNYNFSPQSNEVSVGFWDLGARVTSSGDMSVGLMPPNLISAKLEVRGNGTTSGTYALKIDNNSASPLVHVRDDSYVGFGTSTPSERFEIFDSSAPTALKAFINNSWSSGYAELMMQTNISDMRFGTGGSASTPYGGSPGDCYFGAVSYSNLILATNNTVRMNIRNTGEVGINTGNASLTSQLEVVGPGSTSATYGLKVFNSSYSTPTLRVRDDNVVDINGGGGIGSDFSVLQRGFSSNYIFDVYNNDASVLLALMRSTGTNTGEVRLAHNSLNIDVATKNVEMGFYSGSYGRRLNVRAATTTEEIVSFHAYNATGGHYFAVNSNHPYYFMQNSAYTTTVLFNSVGDSYINGGNVGIGTLTPSATLDLVGTFQYVDGNQASGYVLTSDANGNATWQSTSGFTGSGGQFTGNTSATCITNLYVQNLHSCSPLNLQPGASAGTILMGANGGVSVGIGTTNPSLPAKFTVHTDGATSATYGLQVINSGGETSFAVRDDKYVGVNTASPNYRLDVQGTFNAETATGYHVRWTGTQFLADIGGNHYLKLNRDGLLISEIGGYNSVQMVNTQTTSSLSINSTSITARENTSLRFVRTDNTHYGYVDCTNYYYKLGSLGLSPTFGTSTLHLVGTGYRQLRLENSYTPTGNGDTNGNAGDIAWDENYLYIKTAGNGWGRIALDFSF